MKLPQLSKWLARFEIRFDIRDIRKIP